jgi:anti-sigma-K factor RskA
MNEIWDDDDRAIAQALGVEHHDGPDDAPVDTAAVDEYRQALTHLPFDEEAPPPDLEDRVLAAAQRRRPSTTTAIESAPSKRAERSRNAGRWIVLGGAAVAAVIALIVLFAGSDARDKPAGQVETVGSGSVDVEAVTDTPGARNGSLEGTDVSGTAALAPDGAGVLYELALPAAPVDTTRWLWLLTDDDAVAAGELPAGVSEVAFQVTGDTDRVDGVAISIEPDGITPGRPGAVVARATFSPS